MRQWFNLKNLRLLKSRYKKLVVAVAIVVVFITTYALILPAITLDQNTAGQQAGIEVAEPASSEETEAEPEAEDGTQTETDNSEQDKAEEETELISQPTSLQYSGDDYEIAVDIDAAAKLPVGAELKVKEIDEKSDSYASHYEQTKKALDGDELSYARFFDISFVYKGEEVEPAATVQVHIKYPQGIKKEKNSELLALHFPDNSSQSDLIEVQSTEKEGKVSEVSFAADSFSVYGVVQRGITIEGINYYTVRFVYTDNDGQEQEISTLIDVKEGATIGSLPEDPFKSGYRFDHWENKETGETVTADTPVTDDMTVEAVFTDISIYTVTVNYFYHNNSANRDVTFDSEIYQIEDNDTPYRITPPASTEVSKGEDTSLPADAIYYPEQSLIELKEEDLAAKDAADGKEDQKITINVEYVPYTAEYDYVYMLKDLDGEGYSEIETVHAYGVLGSTVRPQVLSYDYANFEKTESVEITEAKGQKLYVYYTRKNYTLSYDTNGGSYIAPQTGLYQSKQPLTETVPTKTGYDFVGWHEKADLSDEAKTSGSVTLDSDKTLYAEWKGKTVDYTIVYYKEQYDNSSGTTSFVYDSAKSAQGQVGTTVSAADAPVISTDTTGYEKDTAQNTASKAEIAADGSTILKVYYKLKRYTFIFDINNFYGRIAKNGGTYTGSNYRISDVVLGQDVSSVWPSGTNEVYDVDNYSQFIGWTNPSNGNILFTTRRFEVTPDMILGANASNQKTYTANWRQGLVTYNVEYYLQSADDPSVYVKSETYSQTFASTAGSTLSPKEINGFTYRNGTPNGYSGTSVNNYGGTYRFYYNRDSFEIDYYYGSNKIETKSNILFDANINTQTYNFTPERPADVDEDYTWGGWYADAGLTTPYDFTTMPANNVVLYAKWQAPNFTVDFDVNGGDSQAPAAQTVEKYKEASFPDSPTRKYYDFAGWYTEPNGGELYDWSKPVTEDTTLYAHWQLKPLTYTVRYLEAGTNNPVAAEKTETSPAFAHGQTISESALGITGYRPDDTSKTINLDYENNIITFYYSPKLADVTYTIKYVLADNEAIEVAPTVTKTVDGSTIRAKESAVAVDKDHMASQAGVTEDMLSADYYPLENVESLVLSSQADHNVIVFRYRNYDTAQIKVNYLDMDGNPIPGQDSLTVLKKKPGTYTVNRKAIEGYTFEESIDSNDDKNKVIYRIDKGETITIDLYYKKNITVAAQNKEKIYDGKPLTSSGLSDLVANDSDMLAEGDSLDSVAYSGSQTDAGVSQVMPKDLVIKDSDGKERNYYYHIDYTPGVLTVHKQPVTVIINGQTKEKVYDGQEASVTYDDVEIVDSSKLYTESDFSFTGPEADQKIKATDVGTYNLNLENKFVNENPNFEVTFQVSNGQLVIKPRELTLVSASAEKAYDGSSLTDGTVTVNVPDGADYSGFVDGEGAKYTVTGSQTDPGKSENSFSYTLDADTKSQNYEITVEFGSLTVLPTLNVQKTNKGWEALSGGKFQISKWDGNKWAAVTDFSEITIDSKDGANLPGLTAGRYKLKETAAPDGYIVLGDDVYFTVTEVAAEDGLSSAYTIELTNENGDAAAVPNARLQSGAGQYSQRLQIANEPGKALPQTGGTGINGYLVVGLALMASALLGAALIKRKHRRGSFYG
ncbi:LPXTG cell wall anchor domain-containing protein [Streptococcus chenjunshii]|uniref:LPXTG cell wall anchor domain-containing protein n=1 Tax=Streptococcus chenjunshii TaxID=2173853 RepID=A0A372KNL2_9STRE|nr:InlB B-repeat-containing protein [Streptococcus chenjunshii]AXQ77975.1 LPXTG cell wall anchor domain-containing protein [Streptococcus chenjunshii]RFU51781.1 LPXTG cell wall anchor domain-containing protein [Streptococcus chenjunshii]RFU53869.1 LPXTG cell wall anchor domain-containing protein [Streptococcus chenjunshii]